MEHFSKPNRFPCMKLIQFLAVILCLALLACSPQKRLTRLIHKHPELVKDSVAVRTDTIIRNEIRISEISVFKTDTISYTDSVVDYQIIRLSPDTVQVKINVKPDTIYRNCTTRVRTIEVMSKPAQAYLKAQKKKARRWGFVLGAIVGSLTVIAVWQRKKLLPLLMRIPLPF